MVFIVPIMLLFFPYSRIFSKHKFLNENKRIQIKNNFIVRSKHKHNTYTETMYSTRKQLTERNSIRSK